MKFNPKKNQEKPRVYSEVPGAPGIHRVWVWNGSKNEYVVPARGRCFLARRYESNSVSKSNRKSKYFRTLAEARSWQSHMEMSEAPSIMIEQPQVPTPTVVQAGYSSGMTFRELLGKWSTCWLPSKNLSTQLKYRSYFRHFEFLFDISVTDIDPDCIDRWITHISSESYLKTSHPTRCSYIHEMGCLRSILTYYSTRCDRNYRLPFLKDHRKMLKIKEKAGLKKDLTLEQLTAFWDHLKLSCTGTKWEAVYYLAVMQYALYARVQSSAALSVEDFDLTNDRLAMIRKVQWLRKRGYESRVVEGSKTNGGKVFSPIPKLAVQVFKEWKLKSGIQSGLLFQMDGKVIEYRTIQNKYDRALKAANLPFTATHILRHAALTEAYSSCGDLLAVQRLADHTDVRTTQKYAKVRDAQLRKAQSQMDEKLSSVWTT